MAIVKEVPRRLAAIMFTDMVGYSTLVHRNELLGLELLKEHHAIVREALGEFGGREIDTAGDGFVVEFTSALMAVECALNIQKRFAKRNTTCPPERRFKVRIGIHASDVFLTESGGKQGIYGDGVNLAARLQPLAPQGGVCISRAVYDQVLGKVDYAMHFMGDVQLKGFDKPIRVYSVDLESPDWFRRMRRRIQHNPLSKWLVLSTPVFWILVGTLWLVTRSSVSLPPAAPHLPERIAILPFETIGADERGSFVAEGLVGGLISGLSQKGLRVLARDSVVEIQKSHLRPKRVGQELNIGRLVTGRILQEGAEFVINIAIIDTGNEEVEWSKDYRAREQSLVKTQGEIAGDLKSHLIRFQSTSSSSQAPAADPTNNAFLAYIRGQYFLAKRTREGLLKANGEFENAIKLDPKYAAAHAALAMTTDLETWYGLKAPRDAVVDIVRHASEALLLDPASTEAMITLAEVKAYVEYDFTESENLFRRALASNDRHATAHQWYSELLLYLGRYPEAQREIEKALEYDPLSLVAKAAQAMTSYYQRDYERATALLQASLNLESNYMLTHYWLGRIWLDRNDYPRALAEFKKSVELNSDDVMAKTALAHALARAGQKNEARARLHELEELGKRVYISPYHFAVIHAGLDETDEALRLLEKSVDEHASQAVALLVDPRLDQLRSSSELQKIVKKLRP